MELKHRCELCTYNLVRYSVWIKQSHPFSETKTIMNLCSLCYKGLKNSKVKMEILEEY